MNKLLTVVALLLLASFSVAARQETPPIRNFLRINEQFCTGAQPRLEHLEKLKAEGVKAVINLRPRGEHRAAEEEAKAKELGLRYFQIPVVFGEPKEEQATEFLKITDDPENRPAFIHCAGAVRVGAFWMIRRVLRDGWTLEAAEEEAVKVGLREAPHLNEFARRYIEKHRKEGREAEEMVKLDFLLGEWKGKGWVVNWDGSRGDEFSQKTTVRSQADGSVLRIKDGKKYNTPGVSHTSALDASVYYDAGAKIYRWRGENTYGRKRPLEAKLINARALQYGLPYTDAPAPLPNGARRTTIEVTESGEWHETIEVWKIDRWYVAEKALLRRVK